MSSPHSESIEQTAAGPAARHRSTLARFQGWQRALPWREALLILAVAAGLHAAVLFQSTPLQSANDRSRWSTVWSLVHQHTFKIDTIDAVPRWSTIDKVQHEGNLYSTKPALLALIAAGIYQGIHSLTGWSIFYDTPSVTRIILLFLNGIPWMLALIAMAAMARKYAATAFGRRYLLLCAAFGTYLSTFSVTLNNHTIAAVALVFALYYGLKIVADGSRHRFDFAMCGFMSAFVTANEMPAAAFGLAMFFVIAAQDWKKAAFLFVPAALVPIGVFVATTVIQTGSLKPFYAAYGTEKYIYIRDGLPSYWAAPKGIDRNSDSPLMYLFHCTFGHHGIFSLSPIFLLTLLGWWKLLRDSAFALRYRAFLWMGLAMTAVILGFYLTRTENYNYGGNTAGLRWAFWLIPFWLIALLPVVDAFATKRSFRVVAAVLLGVSVFSAWSSIRNPWSASWLYRSYQAAGLTHDRETPPPLPPGLTTWFPTVPNAAADPEREWIELSTPQEQGTETLRLELVQADAERPVIRFTRFETVAGERAEVGQVTATVDRQAFETGKPLASSVISGEPTEAAAIGMLRLYPRDPRFRPGHESYLATPLRDLAFQVRHVTATADAPATDENTAWPADQVFRHYLDVWICPDVPFGVVRVRLTMTNARTGSFISRRDYQLSAAGRIEPATWDAEVRAAVKPH